jgi:hypothetical protein
MYNSDMVFVYNKGMSLLVAHLSARRSIWSKVKMVISKECKALAYALAGQEIAILVSNLSLDSLSESDVSFVKQELIKIADGLFDEGRCIMKHGLK